MAKRKVLFLTGIRSDYGLLKSIMNAVKKHPLLELQLIVSGAHLSEKYGLTVKDIEKDGFKINAKIKNLVESDKLSSRIKSASIQLNKLVDIVEKLNPDIIVSCFDREEAITMALVGTYMNIPVVHIGGGDRVKGNADDYIRHAVTKLAHIHLPATRKNAERIIRMGEERERVICVGSSGLDKYVSTSRISRQELSKIINFDLDERFIILLQHPMSTEAEKAGEEMRITLKAIKEIGIRTAVINPNSDAGSVGIRKVIEEEIKNIPFIKQFINFPVDIFVNLMRNASALVGNSSAGLLETAFIRLPAVNIGKRQEQREHGDNVIFAENDKDKIKEAIKKALSSEFRKKVQNCYNPYGNGHTSEKIANILAKLKLNRKLIQKEQTY